MMAEREFDMIIFGASGFTGKYTLKNVIISSQIEKKHWKIAVAGRNESKLNLIIQEISNDFNLNLDNVSIVIANTMDYQSLVQMAKRTKLVLSAVGPYLLYGEPVVKACLEAGTHCVDVSGEPQFMEGMQLKYYDEAKKTGVYIISACGFDSIPVETGINFLRDNFGPGTINSVESYFSIQNENGKHCINHGTWDSLIEAIKNRSELIPLRKKLYKKFFTKTEPKFKYPLVSRTFPFKSQNFQKYCIPFWESDSACVKRSQLFAFEETNELPIQFHEYMLTNLTLLILMAIMGFFFLILCPFDFGCKLLKNYPAFFTFGSFTKTGPTKEQVEKSSFKMTLIAKGWDYEPPADGSSYDKPPNKEIMCEISGPNAAYETTTICLVQAGITILEESDKMPYTGGVLTSGFAFRRTSLIDKLRRHSITFDLKTAE